MGSALLAGAEPQPRLPVNLLIAENKKNRYRAILYCVVLIKTMALVRGIQKSHTITDDARLVGGFTSAGRGDRI